MKKILLLLFIVPTINAMPQRRKLLSPAQLESQTTIPQPTIMQLDKSALEKIDSLLATIHKENAALRHVIRNNLAQGGLCSIATFLGFIAVIELIRTIHELGGLGTST